MKINTINIRIYEDKVYMNIEYVGARNGLVTHEELELTYRRNGEELTGVDAKLHKDGNIYEYKKIDLGVGITATGFLKGDFIPYEINWEEYKEKIKKTIEAQK